MAEDINTQPMVRNLYLYGGDTFSMKVTVPAGAFDGFAWTGQVRSSRDPSTGTLDAEFQIDPPAAPGDPCWPTLLAVDTRRLALLGKPVKRKVGLAQRIFLVYTGDYDIQIKHPDEPDPVVTIVQGIVSIDIDVTEPS